MSVVRSKISEEIVDRLAPYVSILVFEHTAAQCGYAQDFSAAIARDNFYGCQFHPEKSGNIGLQILENFIKL